MLCSCPGGLQESSRPQLGLFVPHGETARNLVFQISRSVCAVRALRSAQGLPRERGALVIELRALNALRS